MNKLTLIIAIVLSGMLIQAQKFTVKPYNRIKYSFHSLPEEKEVSCQYHFTNELVTKTNDAKLIDEFTVDSVIIKRDYRGYSENRTIYYYAKWFKKKTGEYYKNLFKVIIDESAYSESITINEYVYDQDEITILQYSYVDIKPSENDFIIIKNLLHSIP